MILPPRTRCRWIFWAVLSLLPLTGMAADGDLFARYVAGEHYTKLDKPVPAEAGAEQVRVIEFFLYGCPHCYHLDENVEAWAAKLPEGVSFRRVPVTFSGAGPIYARLFYTAKSLGVLDRLHTEIFKAIHENQRRLTKKADMRAFFVEHGVAGEAFDRAFDSESVKQDVRAATELMRKFGVTSVPSIGVAGRYWVSVTQAGGNEALLSVSDFLVERARSGR